MFKVTLYRHRLNDDVRLYIAAEEAFPTNLIKADWSPVPTFPPDGDHPLHRVRDRIVATGYAMVENLVEDT